MRKTWLVMALSAIVPLQLAYAVDRAAETKSPIGFGTPKYQWNQDTPEKLEVLSKERDAKRGKEAFRPCAGCHKPDGFGIIDGTYPRLNGQHAKVIIKQVTDVRAGFRINPKMSPFANEHSVSPQEIADIAAFLEAEPSVKENGKGPGTDLERGKKLYNSTKLGCTKCHGVNGEGDDDKFYPAVAAQHFEYMANELEQIQQGIRGNSNPKMAKSLKGLTTKDFVALADYLSRLPDYRTVTKAKAAKKDAPADAKKK